MLHAWQDRFGHDFSDPGYLETALTHSSYANEFGPGLESNERLEFLGDAVLELAISGELYELFPQSPEGQLTRLRSELVKERTLAQVARDLDLPALIRLGKGEEAQGGRERDALLADALEALFGAVYVDAGYQAAREVVLRHLRPRIPHTPHVPRTKDPKTQLQEATQQKFRLRPTYAQLGASGPDHAREYEVEVRLPDGRTFRATGGSVKRAEQSAAQLALDTLEAEG